ncbi:unnamed protein product [Leptidea sinapis]|uniref:Uncharacterized protein n=1 Tax=Leptidea sinapis TaxID=189913 RepID=A0A5E4R261_9NEOP|nr:unnamed protein product [Leptidea sinapis]
MATTDSSNDLSSGLTNHKRSHSFNNHHSYSQHTQHSHKSQQHPAARWLLNSCDSLDHSPGWNVTCLRPAPPLRPHSFCVGSDENIGPTHPYAPHQRKSNSYEEDALILKVIEAYCTSARCRNAVSSGERGHFSFGKVPHLARATNSPHRYTNRAADTTKVKRNKSSSAADYLYRPPEARRLLSERKFQLNRSNPNLGECSEDGSYKLRHGHERRSGSHPSLSLTSPAGGPARSARSSTWCCGSFVKQLTKSHHFD